MRAPGFWQDRQAVAGRLLAPLGWIYGYATCWRLAHLRPSQAVIPVICVGNLTAGGAGKTPIVRDLATRLARIGSRPHILSRGHGGSARGPLRIDPELHDAALVGDEPLLLARDAPCWVSVDRATGARAIADAGAGMIIMDDGLQNPRLFQDIKILVVDGESGFGNGRLIPAGPLREPVEHGLGRVDAVVLMGEDRANIAKAIKGRAPLFHAMLESPLAGRLAGSKVLGFAGIGRPEKFRATLAETGAEIADFRTFADHHPYTEAELKELAADADRNGAALATTEKDWVRLAEPWRARVRAIPVAVRWLDEAAIKSWVLRMTADG